MIERFCAETRDPLRARLVRPPHALPPREDDRDRRPRRVRRRHRPDARRRRPLRQPGAPSARTASAGTTPRCGIEGPAVADVAEHFRLRWHGPTDEDLPAGQPPEPSGDVELQVVRTIPEKRLRAIASAAATSRSSSRTCGALRSARAPRLPREPVPLVAGDRRDPRGQAARPAARRLPRRRAPPGPTPNDGADVSRGQVAALIHADDGNARFLACTVYARTGALRDPDLRPREGRRSSTTAG